MISRVVSGIFEFLAVMVVAACYGHVLVAFCEALGLLPAWARGVAVGLWIVPAASLWLFAWVFDLSQRSSDPDWKPISPQNFGFIAVGCLLAWPVAYVFLAVMTLFTLGRRA